MSEELVEQLARRLFEVREAEWRELRPDLNPVSWDEGPETMRELNRAVARECLRQMEWARRECGPKQTLIKHPPEVHAQFQLAFPHGIPDMTKVMIEPLTLAPEDWKP